MAEILTAKDIAETLKISYEKALDFIKYSGIDYIKIGNQYRVHSDKLWSFLSKKGSIHIELQNTVRM